MFVEMYGFYQQFVLWDSCGFGEIRLNINDFEGVYDLRWQYESYNDDTKQLHRIALFVEKTMQNSSIGAPCL